MRRGWVAVVLLASLALGQGKEALERASEQVRSNDPLERVAGVRALATLQPRSSEVVQLLAQAGTDPDERVRTAAAEAFPGSARDARDLWKLVGGGEPAVRRFAARRLAEVAGSVDKLPASTRRLVFAIRDDDEAVSMSMAAVAEQLGADAVDLALELFRDERPYVRENAARVVAHRGGTPLIPRLVPLTQGGNTRVRCGALAALSMIDPPPAAAVDALLASVRDAKLEVRVAALRGMARVRTEPARLAPCLIEALGSPERDEARAAAEALATWDAVALPHLVAALGDASVPRAEAAADLLGTRDDAGPALQELFASEDAHLREGAARCLGRVAAREGQAAAVAMLRTGLRDPDPGVRAQCAWALAGARPELAAAARDDLAAVLSDASPAVLAGGLCALADLAPDDPRVAEALPGATEHPDPAVRGAAGYVTVRRGGRAASAAADLASVAQAPDGSPEARRQALRMLSAFGPDGKGALKDLAKLLGDSTVSPALRAEAARVVGVLLAQREKFGDRHVPARCKEEIEKGLAWLAKAQKDDGRWDCDSAGGRPEYDVGVTSLALLAFLGAGCDDAHGASPEYATNVRAGLAFLRGIQDADGVFRTPPEHERVFLGHALATVALCEVAAATGDRTHAAALQRAVDVCAQARVENSGWGYIARGRKADTFTTVWMMTALRWGELAGLDVDRKAYLDGMRWIEMMTAGTGQVGYDVPGGPCFRAKGALGGIPQARSHAPTAAGLWCRLLVKEGYRDLPGSWTKPLFDTPEVFDNGVRLCRDLPPRWRPGEVDFCYWYFASLALGTADTSLAGQVSFEWQSELERTLRPRQQRDGSWDPDGVWGFAGGRIYTTAMAVLCLLAPTRYPDHFLDPTDFPYHYVAAGDALFDAASDSEPTVRAAARAALAGLVWKLPR